MSQVWVCTIYSGSLKSHLENVHGEGIVNHNCNFCDKVFKNKQYLKKHVYAIHEIKQMKK